MDGRGFNRVDEEEEEASRQPVPKRRSGTPHGLLPNGHRTYGILIQMDERDVLALGRKKQEIQKEGQLPTFKRPSTRAKERKHQLIVPPKEWKPPATGTGGVFQRGTKADVTQRFQRQTRLCAKGVKIHLPGVRPVRQKLRPITVPL
jgi:hypothetical protein